MHTTDTVTLSDSEFDALSYLVKHGPVFSSDIDYPMKWDFIFLKEHKLAKLEPPNPNFLYHLPENRHTAYQFKLTSYGYECYKREASAKQQLIDEQARHEAERKADRAEAVEDKKRDHRHDLKILILGALISAALDFVNNLISSLL